MLLLEKDHSELKTPIKINNLLTMAKFEEELQSSKMVYALVAKPKIIGKMLSLNSTVVG